MTDSSKAEFPRADAQSVGNKAARADEVVVLSAGPASHIVSRQPVPLARPRDLLDLRTQPAFVELYRTIWADLRQEVIRSQRGADAANG